MDPMHPAVDKKNLFASYQQSFMIDDLLTRSKGNDSQPDHYPHPSLPSPPPSSGRIGDGSAGIGIMGTTGKHVSILSRLYYNKESEDDASTYGDQFCCRRSYWLII